MKLKSIFYRAGVVILVLFTLLAILATPVLAESIEVSPNVGPVNAFVFVEGTDFTPGETYRTYFAYGTSHETLVRSATVDLDGSISHFLSIPEVPGDSYVVRIETDLESSSDIFTVTPDIELSDTTVTVGDPVRVDGTGFRANRNINIRLDGSLVATTFTDFRGSFSDTFIVPTCFNRTPEVRASDGVLSADEDLTIIATIRLNPSTGEVGQEITVNGYDFRTNRTITFTFDGTELDTDPEIVRSNSTGCFEATFEVPVSTYGEHTVEASDGIYDADTDFDTQANIELTPAMGQIGAQIEVIGTGFSGEDLVTIRFDGMHVRTAATDADGSFSAQFMVPQDQSGNYEVSASDSVTSAEAQFTLTVSVNISPTTGHVGTNINVAGTGFTGAVTVKYDSTAVATMVADSNGAFTANFPAPKSLHGHHTVTVNDAINTIETTFTMESDAPPVPLLLNPEAGARQGSRPTFEWEEVTDPSGVSYTLQVATDSSFNTLVLDKSGLTQTEYKPSGEEALSSTDRDAPYFWRVMAVDGASNESAWSTPRSFYVFFLPQWAIYVLIVVGTAAISILIYRLSSKK